MGVAFYAMRIAPEGECGVVDEGPPPLVRAPGRQDRRAHRPEGGGRARPPQRARPAHALRRAPHRHRDGRTSRCRAGRVGSPLARRRVRPRRRRGHHALGSRRAQPSAPPATPSTAQRAAHCVECLGQGLSPCTRSASSTAISSPTTCCAAASATTRSSRSPTSAWPDPAGVAGDLRRHDRGHARLRGARARRPTTPSAIGSWSDVFSLASVALLRAHGQEYFDVKNPGELMQAAVSPTRRSDPRHPWLSPELRENDERVPRDRLRLRSAPRAPASITAPSAPTPSAR
jgi:hypothetical protein